MHIPGGAPCLSEKVLSGQFRNRYEYMSGVSINFEMVKYAGFHIQYINVPLRRFLCSKPE